jgi:uncharacterized protein
LHGFIHPKLALKNAEENFQLSDLEKDIIVKHMWPLTVKFPKYKESYVVCLVDKYCSIQEIVNSNLSKFYKMFSTIQGSIKSIISIN